MYINEISLLKLKSITNIINESIIINYLTIQITE